MEKQAVFLSFKPLEQNQNNRNWFTFPSCEVSSSISFAWATVLFFFSLSNSFATELAREPLCDLKIPVLLPKVGRFWLLGPCRATLMVWSHLFAKILGILITPVEKTIQLHPITQLNLVYVRWDWWATKVISQSDCIEVALSQSRHHFSVVVMVNCWPQF